MRRTSEESRDVMLECIGHLDMVPLEILEAVRTHLVKRQASYEINKRKLGFPDLLGLDEISHDLEIVTNSIDCVKTLISKSDNYKELRYERVEENW